MQIAQAVIPQRKLLLKLSRRAYEERVNRTLQGLQLAFVPFGGGSSDIRTRHPFAVSAHGLAQKIEFVISCQPRNISKWAFGI